MANRATVTFDVEPLVLRFELTAEARQQLLHDQAFLLRARLLLHEARGTCYSSDPRVCYDNYHQPMVDAYGFVERLLAPIGADPLEAAKP